jgi:hypothetical protein
MTVRDFRSWVRTRPSSGAIADWLAAKLKGG